MMIFYGERDFDMILGILWKLKLRALGSLSIKIILKFLRIEYALQSVNACHFQKNLFNFVGMKTELWVFSLRKR